MKNLVVVKSYQNGISLHMDENAAFEEILEELAEKFKSARSFFKDVKVALSIEGRILTVEQEKQVIQVISENSDVQIICLIGKNEETNKKFVKALKRTEFEKEENNGKFHRGNLKEGQVLETESSLFLLGDVEKGAAVIAAKDIIIIGNLYGEAYAGANGEENHFVLALKMEPQKCKIGDVRFRQKERGSIWQIKQKNVPQIAYVKDDKIIIETITKELLDHYML